MAHRILVACGTGAATSTHVATRIRDQLTARDVDVITSQCRVQDVRSNLAGVDVVVTTSAFDEELDVPVYSGVPLLTGIGADALIESIVEALTSKGADV